MVLSPDPHKKSLTQRKESLPGAPRPSWSEHWMENEVMPHHLASSLPLPLGVCRCQANFMERKLAQGPGCMSQTPVHGGHQAHSYQKGRAWVQECRQDGGCNGVCVLLFFFSSLLHLITC